MPAYSPGFSPGFSGGVIYSGGFCRPAAMPMATFRCGGCVPARVFYPQQFIRPMNYSYPRFSAPAMGGCPGGCCPHR
jgi:hypothetical protein